MARLGVREVGGTASVEARVSMARDSDSFTILVQSIYVASGLPRPIDALAQLKADIRALADVRTLDEWATHHAGDMLVCHHCGLFACDSTPEARAKAAAWVREQGK